MKKKQESWPDLFGGSPVATAKPKKEAPKSYGMVVASTCGKVGGIGINLASATRELTDAVKRCEDSVATAGILTPGQATKLRDVAEELRKLVPTIDDCRRVVDGIVKAGIAVPKKEEPDLL